MRSKNFCLLFSTLNLCAALLLFFSHAAAQQKLVLIGGGTPPPEALARFVEWAGKDHARVLIIPWATQHPDATFKSMKDHFASLKIEAIDAAPSAPLSENDKSRFLEQLKNATAVFFSGGDQSRIMDVLKDEALLRALRLRYQEGAVFGGTSAGTAIMSGRMITGEGDFKVIDGARVETRGGLGLLPDSVMVDQHFIKRQRENRLFSLLLQGPERLGLGIDEGMALLVTNNRAAEVVGASQVMLIKGSNAQTLMIHLTRSGDIIDLGNGEVTRASAGNSTEQNSLDQSIKEQLASFKGVVSLFAKNLDTGETYALGADNRVRTASTIKIAVMVEAFARVAEGRAKWTDELVLTKAARYAGSGVLPEIADGLRLTLRDAVNLMMVISDNTATNLVLDQLTTDAVNARMEALGFKQIRILRRVGGGGISEAGKVEDNKRFGLGVATSREMVVLLEKLEQGEIVSASASKEMIELLKREQNHFAIGRTMDLPMATKYGALDQLRSAIGIIYSKKGRIAMAITCDDMPEVFWSVDNPAYLLMSRLSLILVERLGK